MKLKEAGIPKRFIKAPRLMNNHETECHAFYLKSEDDYIQAVFFMCKRYRISILGMWNPDFDAENFKKFLRAYKGSGIIEWDADKYSGVDWYVFQEVQSERFYWSDKYECEESYTNQTIAVDKLSNIKNRSERFFKQFEPDYEDNSPIVRVY